MICGTKSSQKIPHNHRITSISKHHRQFLQPLHHLPRTSNFNVKLLEASCSDVKLLRVRASKSVCWKLLASMSSYQASWFKVKLLQTSCLSLSINYELHDSMSSYYELRVSISNYYKLQVSMSACFELLESTSSYYKLLVSLSINFELHDSMSSYYALRVSMSSYYKLHVSKSAGSELLASMSSYQASWFEVKPLQTSCVKLVRHHYPSSLITFILFINHFCIIYVDLHSLKFHVNLIYI
jgi:hypothetical protein